MKNKVIIWVGFSLLVLAGLIFAANIADSGRLGMEELGWFTAIGLAGTFLLSGGLLSRHLKS